jgi:hypothetical protein
MGLEACQTRCSPFGRGYFTPPTKEDLRVEIGMGSLNLASVARRPSPVASNRVPGWRAGSIFLCLNDSDD